ncbi:MAG TPA: amidohydrolase family protein [Thermoanaerobaculia bacterium]|jgi:imidazolonepropionase-like amidohydrolase|nr:amidohydrolase family protein [Thermoanaerobaculia bacterium]
MKKTWIWFSAVAVFVATSVAAQVTAIRAGQLVDPASGTTARDQVILIEAGKITAVGPGLAIPAGATVVDLSKRTVLPGFFDVHTHLCLNLKTQGGVGLQELLRSLLAATAIETTAYRSIEGVANARDMLRSGFTTVRDVGNAGNYADTALRRAIEDGLVPGPTVVNAGRIIAPYGGQYHGIPPERADITLPEYLYADTADEMRKAVRENIAFGAKVIKIVVDDQPYLYSVEDVRTIVKEAATGGLKVAAHCATDAGSRIAAEGGVASVEHAYRATTPTLELMKAKGVFLVGTDFTTVASHEMGMDEYHPWVVDRLKRAYQVGTPVAFGTDVCFVKEGETRGTLSIEFITSFVEAGVAPKQILQAMTVNAARLMGMEKVRGAIAPGFAADIVATSENPLEKIDTVRHVTFVMKGGQVIRND